MPQFRAAWVLPISQPPIRDGWVRTERGRIMAFGHHRRGERTPSDEVDLGSVAILPGLVNAHTHLELSWMRGRINQTNDFAGWIRAVIALQRAGPFPPRPPWERHKPSFPSMICRSFASQVPVTRPNMAVIPADSLRLRPSRVRINGMVRPTIT